MPDPLKPHTVRLTDQTWALLCQRAQNSRQSVSVTAELLLSNLLRSDSPDDKETS